MKEMFAVWSDQQVLLWYQPNPFLIGKSLRRREKQEETPGDEKRENQDAE